MVVLLMVVLLMVVLLMVVLLMVVPAVGVFQKTVSVQQEERRCKKCRTCHNDARRARSRFRVVE